MKMNLLNNVQFLILLIVNFNCIITPILLHGINFNVISGQGVHVTPYPNPTGPTSSTRLAVGTVWFSIIG